MPIIDVWLEEAIINFIMNTPSQLFMTFYKNPFTQKSSKIDKTVSPKLSSPSRSIDEKNNINTMLTT